MKALLAVLGVVALQRCLELLHSRRTARALAAMGARPVRPDGFVLILAVHVAWFAGMLLESATSGASYGWWTWSAGAAFLAGQAIRYLSMRALGSRWNTRVWVLPQAPLVARGPYRFMRHPIYVGVFLELLALPLAFGLWWTAGNVSAIHLVALGRRIALEESALGIRPSTPSRDA